MIMADVFTVVFLVLGLWLALPALCLVLRAAAPQLVERAQAQVAAKSGRALLAGSAILVVGLAAVAALGALPGPAKLVALLMASRKS